MSTKTVEVEVCGVSLQIREGAEHFILRKAAQDGVLGRVAAMALEYHNFFKESGDALADLLREHFDLVEMMVQNRSCGIIKASRNATG